MAQLERANLDNHLLRLSDEQMLYPFTVFEEFCSAFNLGQIRTALSELAEVCLTVENEIFGRADKRADALYITKNIELVIEAVYLINSIRLLELGKFFTHES